MKTNMKMVITPGFIVLYLLLALSVIAETPLKQPGVKEDSASTCDLYKVFVRSHDDARALSGTGADVFLKVKNGYLVLIESGEEELLIRSGLEFEFIAADVDRDHLALDMRFDGVNITKYPLVYEEAGLRLLRVDPEDLYQTKETPGLAPVLTDRLKVVYKEPTRFDKTAMEQMADLDSMINLVVQDSLQSYLERLQAFNGRVTGTDSNYASRDWIAGKFTEFGYDSVAIDSFIEIIYGVPTECQNVIAYKVGSTYPDFQIVIGAHRDAVPGSPGADDNGTGTAGVLEVARILKDVETELTFIFVLFDGEEQGLHGAWHYANRAALAGDSIVCMLNMDMIGHYENNSDATLYHSSDDTYARLWQYLADSLTSIGIGGHLSGTSAHSDHFPFQQNGYDVVFSIEYIFSSVYHTQYDSTAYIGYDYFTRVVKATLATAYAIDGAFVPTSWLLFSYPGGVPEMLTPMEPNTFEIMVQGTSGGTSVPGSGYLHYSVGDGDFVSAPLSELGGGLYEGTFPALPCDTRVAYYISVDEATSGTIYNPDPGSPALIPVATSMTIILEDDFEVYNGWSVTGDAAEGQWMRAIPVGGGLRGDPPADYDGSGKCYVTGNQAGDSDVDNGITNLVSPIIDLQGNDALVSYARWYSNDFGNAPYSDVMEVFISNNGGSLWTLAETAGPVEQASGGWYVHSFWVSDFMEPTGQMRLKFAASDLGDESVVEAAVDAVRIALFDCFWFLCGDADGSEAVNILDVARLINYLYKGGPAPEPIEAADVNDSGAVNLLDITYLINYLYKGGPEPHCPQ